MALNARRQRFVELFTGPALGNGAEACRRAGYKATRAKITASELLRDPEVQEAIRARQAPAQEASVASRTEALTRLTRIVRSEGEKTPNVIRAIEVISRMSGWDWTRIELLGGDLDLSKLDDDQLGRLEELVREQQELVAAAR